MDRTRRFLSAAASAVVLLAAGAVAAPPSPPASPKRPVTDEVQVVKIVDDYRWLEDSSNPEVQKWSADQNAYARSYLDRMKAIIPARARMTELETAVGVQYHSVKFAGGKFFASKSQPPKQQPLVVMLPSLTDTIGERVIIDPNTLDSAGHTAFDWFVPSPDGSLVAVSLSEGGSESGNVHIYSTEDGRELLGDMIPRVNGGTAGGSLAWLSDSSGFLYTRYPREGERASKDDLDFYTQVWRHDMGRPTEHDVYQTGKDFPKIAEIMLEVSPDGRWALCNVQNGDGGEFIQEIRDLAKTGAEWTQLSQWSDGIVEAKFGRDNSLYLVSRKNAPMGKILRLPLTDKPLALTDAKQIIPEQKNASVETAFDKRTGLWLAEGRLYVLYQIGGPNELRQFGLDGSSFGSLPQPDISTVEDVEVLAGNDLSFQIDTFTNPPAYFTFHPTATGGKATKTALEVAPPPHMPKMTVKREFAISKDGTRVPLNIIMPEGLKPNGHTPTIVWGYGGYGVNETPGFSPRRPLWIEQGCIFVVTNIRGGGEYGEKWHHEGNLTHKQNVFDDFYAATKYMMDKGYTDHDHLAIFGGSNGGLLMGATFTQHPDLCKAVVSSVGIYDMLRVELSANGAFNVTEFGTVKDKAQFDALYAYSPYHHVKDGTHYSAILFMTGANDPRVDPMQSRKMTARLQAADPTGLFLLRTSSSTGHGMGTPLTARIEESVDLYCFLFEQLGVDYKPVK